MTKFFTQYQAPEPARTEKISARAGWFLVESSPDMMQTLAQAMGRRKDLSKIEAEFLDAIVGAIERGAMRRKK